MMVIERISVKWVLILMVAVFAGCSTVGVQVPRLMPARKGNLGRFKTAAVSEFAGLAPGSAGAAVEISDGVRQSLASYKGLSVLDRSRLGQVLSELQLSASELTDPAKRQQLGKMMTAGVLVAGKVTTYEYNEDVQKEERTCTDHIPESQPGRQVTYQSVEHHIISSAPLSERHPWKKDGAELWRLL